ncbi:hypothetical protein P0M28_07745 [Tunicatimonas pelagia]|nr:hypothetical protein [Tunicatimonas pelagia]WKN44853.1 hypothetical protein P0M28_07745 [Tunicatimonas pelagia]
MKASWRVVSGWVSLIITYVAEKGNALPVGFSSRMGWLTAPREIRWSAPWRNV